MRDKEKKHRKGQETTIGKIIYGFLLFMPLIAIASTILINTFNKNAKLQTQANDNIEYTNVNELTTGERYYFNPTLNQVTNNTGSQKIYEFWLNNIELEYSYTPIDWNNVKKINIYINSGTANLILYLYDANSISLGAYQLYSQYTFSFYFNLVNQINTQNFEYVKQAFYEPPTTEPTTNTLSNSFYYAVDKVTESPLFNWAQNSIIYTTTASTCTALSITTPFIPLLLSYWLIISVIYFLYDIALMLVWLIHRKIHELQESL